MELNKLAKEVHENAVNHGWWENERSFAGIIDLIHSELTEALEEVRNGHELNEVYYTCGKDYDCALYEPMGINKECNGCPKNKPEGVPIELADTVIRILDYFGRHEIDPCMFGDVEYQEADDTETLLAECHFLLSESYKKYKLQYPRFYPLMRCIETIFAFCKRFEIDIEEAIKIKHEYNKTRPYKHGGKSFRRRSVVRWVISG